MRRSSIQCGLTTLKGTKCRRRIATDNNSCGIEHREEVNPGYNPMLGEVLTTSPSGTVDADVLFVDQSVLASLEDMDFSGDLTMKLIAANALLERAGIPVSPRVVGESSKSDLTSATAQAMLRLFNQGDVDLDPVAIGHLHRFLSKRERASRTKLPAKPVIIGAKAPEWLEALDGRNIVLVDLDGTLYDAMSCHGIRGDHGASEDCPHVRYDTMSLIQDACERHNAVPVVLSWRPGMYQFSKEWCEEISLDPVAVLVPGSPDAKGLEIDAKSAGGQTGFKTGVIASLDQLGAPLVASFEDNHDVLRTMRQYGVPELFHIPRLVDLHSHEWWAGYMGAPEPKESWFQRVRARLRRD